VLRLLKVHYKQVSRWGRLAQISLENKKTNLSQQPLGEFDLEKLQILQELKTLSVEENKVRFELSNGGGELCFFKNGIIQVTLVARNVQSVQDESVQQEPTQQESSQQESAQYERPAQVEPPIPTQAVLIPPPPAEIEVEQIPVQGRSLKEQGISVKYHRYRAQISFNPFGITLTNGVGKTVCKDRKVGFTSDRMVVCKELRDEHFYGGGEQTGPLDKSGRYLEYWNTDVFGVHNDDTLHMYCSIPFIIGFPPRESTESGEGEIYGLFIDDGGCSFFDLGKKYKDLYCLGVNHQSLSYYIIPGKSMKEVVEKYTLLTGRMELPPLWGLGFHLSKWSYFPYERVYKTGQFLRKKKIPADAVHLDIDYMDGYRVFTFDRDYFPNPQKMGKKLESMGFKVVTILDPGVKEDSEYLIYQAGLEQGYFVKNKDGIPFSGEVWGKKSAFPDFLKPEARRWWAGLVKAFVTTCGISGIWNDMNEPSEFTSVFRTLPDQAVHSLEGKEVPHKAVHNLYGFLENQATYEGLQEAAPDRRPFILSRSGFAGIQRYAALWTGDNRSRFAHLALAIPMNCNLGLSGVAFVGNDVGGFNENCWPELFARWIELGAFTPFFRVHNICNARPQEPWAFGEEIEEISRTYINLRYQLLPYIYNQFYRAHKTGIPVMAPLVLEYQDDPEVLSLDNQYLFGSDLLIAPVLQEGQTQREVYLPKGWWFDFWSDRMFQGGTRIRYEAPLARLPIFVKADAIIPSWEVIQTTSAGPVRELRFDFYPVTGGTLYYYEDDGETTHYKKGQYNMLEVAHSLEQGDYKISLKYLHKGFTSSRETLSFRLHGVRGLCRVETVGRPGAVDFTTCSDDEQEPVKGVYNSDKRIFSFTLPDQGDDFEVHVQEEQGGEGVGESD